MGRAYYYLVASLPSLFFGSRPPMSYEDFLEDCNDHLSEEDFSVIKNLTLEHDKETGDASPVVNAWARLNHDLKNERARLRAARAGKNPVECMREERRYDAAVAQVVVQAAKAPDPLATEKILDGFRWRSLDELEWRYHFTLEYLIIYALKLQMLERFHRIEFSARGREIFEQYKSQLP